MSNASALNPLKMALAINRDTRLSASERVALVGAVSHADNGSRKVCFSQMALADQLALSRDTVKRAFGKGLTFGYFSHKTPWRNSKGQMMTDYYFVPLPPVVQDEATDTVVQEKPTEAVVQAVVQEKAPSTTSTSNTSDLAFSVTDHQRPVSNAPEWKQRQYIEKEFADEGFDATGNRIGNANAQPSRYRGRSE